MMEKDNSDDQNQSQRTSMAILGQDARASKPVLHGDDQE